MAVKLDSYKRSRCIGWDATGKKGVYSEDLTNDDGTVNEAMAKTLGIDPAAVKPITVADLPADYSQGPREALAKLAAEWGMDANDLVHDLVIKARMQDAANDSVKAHRPVSDKAKERAYSTLVKTLAVQNNISEAEVETRFAAVLSALK